MFRSDKASNDISEVDRYGKEKRRILCFFIFLFASIRFLEGRDDSIAKPFYSFIDLIFDEQGGLFKLIRMTLVQFIRVTYGSTINRQVRRYIVNLFQEEYFVKCLIMFRDAFWPKNPPAERPVRVEEDKHERRQHAKRQLLSNIPGICRIYRRLNLI